MGAGEGGWRALLNRLPPQVGLLWQRSFLTIEGFDVEERVNYGSKLRVLCWRCLCFFGEGDGWESKRDRR